MDPSRHFCWYILLHLSYHHTSNCYNESYIYLSRCGNYNESTDRALELLIGHEHCYHLRAEGPRSQLKTQESLGLRERLYLGLVVSKSRWDFPRSHIDCLGNPPRLSWIAAVPRYQDNWSKLKRKSTTSLDASAKRTISRFVSMRSFMVNLVDVMLKGNQGLLCYWELHTKVCIYRQFEDLKGLKRKDIVGPLNWSLLHACATRGLFLQYHC